MKKLLLVFLLAAGYGADAQTLKDLLYSGKLKKDSSGVVRSTDDLKSKIDTSQKKEVVPEKPKTAALPADAPVQQAVPVGDTVTVKSNVDDRQAVPEGPAAPAPPAAPAKSNTKLLKEYSDSLVLSLKEAISSKKVKKETYFFTFEYEIDTDGQVSVTSVSMSPDNSYLLELVRERLLSTPPRLSAATDSAGNAKKVKRRHSFTITKD